MKVTLTAYTPDPIRQMYLAAKRCTTATLDVNEEVDREEMERVVKNCIRAGHLTVCEFATFNFHIEQITRSCSHQLVRHRHASFCQMSERRVSIGMEEDFYLLEQYINDIPNNEKVREILHRFFGDFPEQSTESVLHSFLEYKKLLNNGVSAEQARSVLPQCTLTNLYMHVNFRELMHICALRLCSKAESEIREMCVKMVEAVTDVQGGPFLLQFLRPKCFNNGRCNEAKPCGVYTWGK